MRQFYLGRNSSGYYRVYFIDPVTGLRDSGKSTHTKDKVEATMIATSWLQNGAPDCRSNSRAFSNPTSLIPINLKNMVEHLSEDDAYEKWCTKNNEHLMSHKWLSTQMQEKGFKKRLSNGSRFWPGLSVRSEWQKA